jgi:hypothetical protein
MIAELEPHLPADEVWAIEGRLYCGWRAYPKVLAMQKSPFCSCKNRKYMADPHEPGCSLGYSYSYGVFPKYTDPSIFAVPRKCTCGNADDKTCKTGAHSSWCDGIKP